MGIRNNKISFKNDLATALIIAIGTFLFILFIKGIFAATKGLNDKISLYYGFAFGSGLSALFYLTFIISGGLRNAYNITVKRWSTLFEDLGISFKFAIKGYFNNIKEEGIALVCYIIVLITQIFTSYYGFVKFLEIYH